MVNLPKLSRLYFSELRAQTFRKSESFAILKKANKKMVPFGRNWNQFKRTLAFMEKNLKSWMVFNHTQNYELFILEIMDD